MVHGSRGATGAGAPPGSEPAPQEGASLRGTLKALNTGFLLPPPAAAAAPTVRLTELPSAAGAEAGTVPCLPSPPPAAGLSGGGAAGPGSPAAGSSRRCCCCCFRQLGRMGLSACRAPACSAPPAALAGCVPSGRRTRCAAAGSGADCAAVTVTPALGPALATPAAVATERCVRARADAKGSGAKALGLPEPSPPSREGVPAPPHCRLACCCGGPSSGAPSPPEPGSQRSNGSPPAAAAGTTSAAAARSKLRSSAASWPSTPLGLAQKSHTCSRCARSRGQRSTGKRMHACAQKGRGGRAGGWESASAGVRAGHLQLLPACTDACARPSWPGPRCRRPRACSPSPCRQPPARRSPKYDSSARRRHRGSCSARRAHQFVGMRPGAAAPRSKRPRARRGHLVRIASRAPPGHALPTQAHAPTALRAGPACACAACPGAGAHAPGRMRPRRPPRPAERPAPACARP